MSAAGTVEEHCAPGAPVDEPAADASPVGETEEAESGDAEAEAEADSASVKIKKNK